MHITISLGAVFSIPLTNDRFCSGVITAISRHKKIKILQVYILNCDTCKLLDGRLPASKARNDSILIAETNSTNFINGTWPIVGTVPNWRQEEWFISEFCYQTIDGGWHKATYDTNLKRSPGGDITKKEAGSMPENRILPGPALQKTIELMLQNT